MSKYTDFSWKHKQIDFTVDHGLSTAVGVRTVFIDEPSKIAVISDEPVWQSLAVTGDALKELGAFYQAQGYKTAVTLTPYTFHGEDKVMAFVFGPEGRPANADFAFTIDKGGMSADELKQLVKSIGADGPEIDIIGIDPYYFNEAMVDKATLLKYTEMADEVLESMGKESLLVMQGFGFAPDTRAFLAEQAKLGGYDYYTSFNAIDAYFPISNQIDDAEVAAILDANLPVEVLPVVEVVEFVESTIQLVNEPIYFWDENFGGGA